MQDIFLYSLLCPGVTFAAGKQPSIARPLSQWWITCSAEKRTSIRQNEETVKKDTQTAGGTRGFSLKSGAVSCYYLTAEHRAGALKQLRQEISIQGSVITKHTDLEKIRIKRDESDVTAMVELLENNWTNPFGNYPSDHVSISTGTVASPAVSTDLLAAHEKGEHANKEFEQQRIQKGDCFHDPIKKINLKTFSAMKRRNQWFHGRNSIQQHNARSQDQELEAASLMH